MPSIYEVRLTRCEKEILALLVNSPRHSNHELAQHLFVSTNTIKTHLKNLFRKAGVHRRRYLVQWGGQRKVAIYLRATLDSSMTETLDQLYDGVGKLQPEILYQLLRAIELVKSRIEASVLAEFSKAWGQTDTIDAMMANFETEGLVKQSQQGHYYLTCDALTFETALWAQQASALGIPTQRPASA